MMVESMTLSTLGGVAGILVAAWGVPILAAAMPESLGLPNAAGIKVDGAVLLAAIAATLFTGLLFGIAPVLQLKRETLRDSLKEGARGSTGSARGRRLRSTLVVAQVAMSLILLAGAGLLLRTLYEMERISLGFNPHHVLTVPVESATNSDGPASIARALDRVRGLPGVQAAGSVSSVPLTGVAGAGPVWAFGQPRPADYSEMVTAKVWRISKGYLATMGIPLLAGHDFDEGVRPGAPTVAIVNESLVRQFFPRGEYLGKRIVLAGFSVVPFDLEIVGVTADTKSYQLTADSGPQVFLDNAQGPLGFGVLVIRTEGESAAVAGAVRREIRSASPNLIPGNPKDMEFYLASALAKPRFSAILLACFATIAMLLSAIG
ncbi:MAG: ABC transporter permease, partial [Bryobacteraceae bacterium]